MKKIEVNRDLLYKYYIEENYNIQETADLMGISSRTIQRAIKNYGFNKDSKQIQRQRKDTLLEKYGVENTYQLDSSIKKSKQTKLERYGDENYNNCKKHTETLYSIYGVTSPALLDKSKESLMIHYGVSSPMKSKEIKNKVKDTMMKRYGVPYYFLSNRNGHTISKINKNFSNLLNNSNIENELEFVIDRKSYDLHILNSNILIEINPTYTHNSTLSCWFNNYNKPPLVNTYHIEKTKLALDNGYRCIHIWDWDDINKIIGILKPKEKIYARKCIIKDVSLEDCAEFLNNYHLQNTCKGQDIRLGLYYKDELVEIMTFGEPRYNKKYNYELLRLCTKSNYKVIGGASRLFKYFIKVYQPKSIISYCDNSKFDGNIYKFVGFELKDFGGPSKHWFNGERHITDNLLRQRGFDQLFNMNYGKGTSNEELMKEYGFVEIYDSGQSTYIWKNI